MFLPGSRPTYPGGFDPFLTQILLKEKSEENKEGDYKKGEEEDSDQNKNSTDEED